MTTTNESAEIKLAAIKRAKEEFRDTLKAIITDVFVGAPEDVVAVTWTQYTPHFNDGEPCVFGMNDWYIITKTADTGVDSAEKFAESSGGDPYEIEDEYPGLAAAWKTKEFGEWGSRIDEITRLLGEEDSVTVAMFGDGVKVTALRGPNDAAKFVVVDHYHD